MAYVYKISNSVNDRYYIGICRGKYTPNKLFWLKTNPSGFHCNKKLRSDVLKLGRECFKLEVLKETDNEHELLDVYDENIAKNHREMEYHYNINKHYSHPPLRPKSEETKRKMSVAKKGSVYSAEILQRRADGQRNRFAKLKEEGKKVIVSKDYTYLIRYNNRWHYFPNFSKTAINQILLEDINYIERKAGNLLNSGFPLVCSTKKFTGIIIYNDVNLINQKLQTVDYIKHDYRDYNDLQ